MYVLYICASCLCCISSLLHRFHFVLFLLCHIEFDVEFVLPHYYVSTPQRVNILYISTLLCFKFPIYYISYCYVPKMIMFPLCYISILLLFRTIMFPQYVSILLCFHNMFPYYYVSTTFFQTAIFLRRFVSTMLQYVSTLLCFLSIVFICSALTLSCLQFYWFCFSFSASFILFPL